MRIYTVHVRTPATRLDRDIVLVKEGFSWPAFVLSVIWALWMRLWLVALIFLAVEVTWSLLAGWLGLTVVAQVTVSLGLAVMIGFVANDLRRWTLFRRGYAEVGVAAAGDRDAALQRFLDQHTRLAEGLLR
jgi:type III secretory pathway component EscR